jgi:putative flippase GtrA
MLGYAVAIAANLAAVELLLAFGVHPLAAQALSLPLIVVLAYSINARIVFKDVG